jgi:hypothetical protein
MNRPTSNAGRDMEEGTMRNTSLAMGWAVLAGIVLLASGVLGFLNTSLAGTSADAILRTDTVHNVVHVVTGLLALGIAFALKGDQLVNGVIGFGILYVVIFAAVLLSPNLFGLFSVPANASVHVVHGAVAVVSLAVGYMARGTSSEMAR